MSCFISYKTLSGNQSLLHNICWTVITWFLSLVVHVHKRKNIFLTISTAKPLFSVKFMHTFDGKKNMLKLNCFRHSRCKLHKWCVNYSSAVISSLIMFRNSHCLVGWKGWRIRYLSLGFRDKNWFCTVDWAISEKI